MAPDFKKFTTEQLKTWCQRFYGSGNMLFVISGNFSKNEVIKLLKSRLKKAHPIKIIPKQTYKKYPNANEKINASVQEFFIIAKLKICNE